MSWNREVQVIAGTAVLLMAGSSPVAAQGIPQPTPVRAVSASPEPVSMAREASGWLADLIKINTSNPPGNENLAAMFVSGLLQKEGIKAEILDVGPGRSAVVASLRSSVVPYPSKALLLVAHLDVVPVDKAWWTVDPFSGAVRDGYMYGRGAIDEE